MKKVLIVLSTLFLLCACSSAPSTKISNGSELFYKNSSGKGITKQEVYDNVKSGDITETLKNTIILKIAALENVDVAKYEADAKDYISSLEEQGYGEFIAYYYGSKEAYIKNSVVFEVTSELCRNVIKADYDTYLNEYNPFKAEIIYVEDEDVAKAIIDYYKENNSTFAYACSENGYDSQVNTSVYNGSTNDLPDEVNSYIKTAEVGVSPVIKVDTVTTDADGKSVTSSRYYLVNLLSKDAAEFEAEFYDYIVNEMDKDTVIINLIKKYNLEVHDQQIYELLKNAYGEVIK